MDQTSRHDEGRPPLVGTGCLMILVGGALLIATLIAEATGAGSGTLRVMAIVALALIAPSAGYLIWLGLAIRRRAKRGLDSLAFAPEVPVDLPMLRRIEASRLPALARWDGFPSAIRTSRQIENAGTPISFAVNLPRLGKQRRTDPIEPPSCYIWGPLPVSLPRLIIRPDARDAALLGADVDVENEEFNRRFRVDSTMPLQGGRVEFDLFARYAHAMLHPRAVEILMRLPEGVHLALDGGHGFAIDRVDSDRERIELIAEVLTGFAALAPQHVVNRWGGQSGYLLRD